jgi:hypothetical protein
MATPPVNPKLGERLADGQEVYRAFAYQSYRRRKGAPPHEVRHFAYLLGEDDVEDGLSVGLTPRDAVKGLVGNFGYCSISVGVVHSFEGLEVRADITDPNHAFICNLPLRTISDLSESKAIFLARELARKSICITCDPYIPNGCPPPTVESAPI